MITILEIDEALRIVKYVPQNERHTKEKLETDIAM